MPLTHGSLFAGVGGFDAAADAAGIETRWQVEIDPFCRRVLARHWPDVRRYSDICGVRDGDLEPVDIVTFGSPCQDLSTAGQRRGLDGVQSGLFYQAIRLVRDLHPAIAVWENVPGALSSAGGRDFGTALDALANAGAVDIGWRVLDARWFGVPQRRRRVFVVADFGGRRAAEILALAEGGRGHSAASRTTGADLAFCLTAGPGVRRLQHEQTYVLEGSAIGFDHTQDPVWASEAVPTLAGQGQAIYQCHGGNVGPLGALRQGNGGLTGGVPFVVSRPSTAHVRRLTPVECERLQGFGDGWTCLCGVQPYTTS